MLKDFLKKVETALQQAGGAISETAGKAGSVIADTAGKAGSVVADVATTAFDKSVELADDARDAVLDLANLRDVKTRLIDEITDACRDGVFDEADLAAVNGLQGKLNIPDADMAEIKTQALREIITRVLADGEVTEQELALVQQLHSGLGLAEHSDVAQDYQKVTALAVNK